MPLGIDPKVDYAFKKLFGDPANSDLLIHLLNAVLKPETPIVEVDVLNPFNEKEFAEDKLSVLDIKARDAREHWYNVEMQSRAHGVLRQRLPYYNALLYVGQLLQGDDYRRLMPAISVCFLNGVLFPETEAPHLSFSLSDCRQGVRLGNFLQIHTVELPKYNFDETAVAAADALVKWCFFLSRAASFEVAELKQLLPERAFSKATGVMEMISRTPEERELYESRRKAELDFKSSLAAAADEAMERGLEKGLKIGLVHHIQDFQTLLGQPITAESELMSREFESLEKLRDDLKAQLKRRS